MTPPTSTTVPTLAEYAARIDAMTARAEQAFAAAGTDQALELARVEFLGDKRGALIEFQKALGRMAPADRPEAGRRFNAAKERLTSAHDARRTELARSARGTSVVDPTMPARRRWIGAKHPVTLVIEEIEEIFRELGFTVAAGPEAESEWYNFGALNFPPEHPAMDMHDTLYLAGEPGGGDGDRALLRTHTSPVQVRTLQSYPPPIRILAPGNAYRRDFFDASHAPVFAQVEGMAVDEGISFVDLKATLTWFANRFFGETRTRFRPSYFPFTEPSAEMDVECRICGGRGCAGCKGTGWMEILGSGLMHPAVLEAAGLDSERYTGWAFGMGPGRIAMQRYGIPDIRLLYDSDVRFLEQFAL